MGTYVTVHESHLIQNKGPVLKIDKQGKVSSIIVNQI